MYSCFSRIAAHLQVRSKTHPTTKGLQKSCNLPTAPQNVYDKSLYLTKIDKSNIGKMKSFGETIREIRESKGLLLRQAAAFLEVDTAFVSKLERGERKASREQVEKLADFLTASKNNLITVWLTEKVIELVNNDSQGEAVLKLAIKELKKR